MDVMYQPLHIDRITRVAVDGRRVVALDAIFDVEACFAMQLEVVMTGITTVTVDDQACKNRCAACRQEIERCVVSRDIFRPESA